MLSRLIYGRLLLWAFGLIDLADQSGAVDVVNRQRPGDFKVLR